MQIPRDVADLSRAEIAELVGNAAPRRALWQGGSFDLSDVRVCALGLSAPWWGPEREDEAGLRAFIRNVTGFAVYRLEDSWTGMLTAAVLDTRGAARAALVRAVDEALGMRDAYTELSSGTSAASHFWHATYWRLLDTLYGGDIGVDEQTPAFVRTDRKRSAFPLADASIVAEGAIDVRRVPLTFALTPPGQPLGYWRRSQKL